MTAEAVIFDGALLSEQRACGSSAGTPAGCENSYCPFVIVVVKDRSMVAGA